MRSHYCGQVTEALAGQTVHVCGWVHRRRDHGGVIFIDLRDREGLLQLVFDPEAKETFAAAEKLRSEFVVRASNTSLPAIINAFDEAFGKALKRIVEWAVEEAAAADA